MKYKWFTKKRECSYSNDKMWSRVGYLFTSVMFYSTHSSVLNTDVNQHDKRTRDLSSLICLGIILIIMDSLSVPCQGQQQSQLKLALLKRNKLETNSFLLTLSQCSSCLCWCILFFKQTKKQLLNVWSRNMAKLMSKGTMYSWPALFLGIIKMKIQNHSNVLHSEEFRTRFWAVL